MVNQRLPGLFKIAFLPDIFFFTSFVCAVSVYNAYTNTREERDDAREDCTSGAYEWCDLQADLETRRMTFIMRMRGFKTSTTIRRTSERNCAVPFRS